MTISGGGASFDFESDESAGISTGLSGSHIRFSISLACVAVAVFSPRRRFTGLRDRGSADIGIASGIGSDILISVICYCEKVATIACCVECDRGMEN